MRDSGRYSVRFFVSTILVVLLSGRSFVSYAECGDTNGDDLVDASDALRTLQKAVGLPVDVQCPIPEVHNSVAFVNTTTCFGIPFTATFRWSEHSELTWTSFSDPDYPVDALANSQRVDDSALSGLLFFDYGDCGQGFLNLGFFGYTFPLPDETTTTVIVEHQESDNTVYVFLNIQPIVTTNSVNGSATSIGQTVALGALVKLDDPSGN